MTAFKRSDGRKLGIGVDAVMIAYGMWQLIWYFVWDDYRSFHLWLQSNIIRYYHASIHLSFTHLPISLFIHLSVLSIYLYAHVSFYLHTLDTMSSIISLIPSLHGTVSTHSPTCLAVCDLCYVCYLDGRRIVVDVERGRSISHIACRRLRICRHTLTHTSSSSLFTSPCLHSL